MELGFQHYAPAASLPGEVSNLMCNRDKCYFTGNIYLFAIYCLTAYDRLLHVWKNMFMNEHVNAVIMYPFIIPSFVLLYSTCMYGNHINCSVDNILVTATKKWGDLLKIWHKKSYEIDWSSYSDTAFISCTQHFSEHAFLEVTLYSC
jgi:hypothetical protein